MQVPEVVCQELQDQGGCQIKLRTNESEDLLVGNLAASAESVGDGGFWESTEGVVEGKFEGVELAEAVGVSEYHLRFG